MKAKPHAVVIDGKTRLVMARTKAGAVRDVLEERMEELRKNAVVELATGEQIYEAGQNGDGILGHEKFKRADNIDQQPLPLPPGE